MPNLLNGLVNGWVKVNSKHVIFPRDDHRGRDTEGQEGNESSSSSVLDRSRGKSSRKQSQPTVSTASTHSTLDPEALAIKKFNSKRQNRRRLQRTISHTDLLREMANGEVKTKSSDRSSTRDGRAASREVSYDPHRTGDNTNDEPVRLMAGFFGSEVGDGEKRSQRERRSTETKLSQNGPVTTGKYLNEAMFVQQLEHTKASRRSDSSSAGGSSLSEPSSYKQTSRLDSAGAPHQDLENKQRSLKTAPHGVNQDFRLSERSESSPRQKYAVRAAAGAASHNGAHQHDAHHCSHCDDLESQLLAAYEDIRYLRDVSLRSEYSKAPSKPKSSILRASSHELTTLADASKRLTEITGRHRRQIEQMTREIVSESGTFHRSMPFTNAC